MEGSGEGSAGCVVHVDVCILWVAALWQGRRQRYGRYGQYGHGRTGF